jgi:hypothetical protein
MMVGTYPNPADASVTLEYRVERSSHVTLEVFDLLGRRIESLVSRYLPTGRYVHEWHRTHAGPGRYMYRLTSGRSTQSGLFLLN